MKTLRFFLCVSMTLVVLFCACDKSDRPLEHNSLSVENQSFTWCIDSEELTKAGKTIVQSAMILEVEDNILKIIRQGEFSCGAKMEVKVTNEGNTITLSLLSTKNVDG